MGFADNLFDFEVKEAVGVDRGEHYRGIGFLAGAGAGAGAGDGDDLFVSAYQPGGALFHRAEDIVGISCPGRSK